MRMKFQVSMTRLETIEVCLEIPDGMPPEEFDEFVTERVYEEAMRNCDGECEVIIDSDWNVIEDSENG